jgi:hypothetical protein
MIESNTGDQADQKANHLPTRRHCASARTGEDLTVRRIQPLLSFEEMWMRAWGIFTCLVAAVFTVGFMLTGDSQMLGPAVIIATGVTFAAIHMRGR